MIFLLHRSSRTHPYLSPSSMFHVSTANWILRGSPPRIGSKALQLALLCIGRIEYRGYLEAALEIVTNSGGCTQPWYRRSKVCWRSGDEDSTTGGQGVKKWVGLSSKLHGLRRAHSKCDHTRLLTSRSTLVCPSKGLFR